MPEKPPGKKRRSFSTSPSPNRSKPRPSLPASDPPPYAELHAKTNFSFLEGASHPDELVRTAQEHGYTALAVTDRASLAGVVRAHMAAKEAGLPFIIGAELTPKDASPVILWAMDRAGYGRLARLITLGRRRAEKGQCDLSLSDLASTSDGLLAGVPLATLVADPPRGSKWPADSPFGDRSRPLRTLGAYREIYGDRCYAIAELFLGPDDERDLRAMRRLADKSRLPLAAANDVHYHDPDRGELADCLTAIRLGQTVAQAAEHLFANRERYLQPRSILAEKFSAAPGALARTLEIAGRCHFSLDELRYEYPEELCPPGQTPIQYLAQLTWAGARERYPAGVTPGIRSLIEHELRLIEQLHYEAYFLTVWDLVRFARGRGILCQGRGSAANSVVCFCLGVTSVDPGKIDVLFERFVSQERNEAPDIDVDFEHERREEVLQYLFAKYGRERAGLTAEVITYQPRSAVRDVGKALGLSLDRVDAMAKSLENYRDDATLAGRLIEGGLDTKSELGQRLIRLVSELLDFPRHLSQHVGGMVMTQGPLCELVPIENAAMADRTVVQWDKDDLDDLGILKVDVLALGMLTAIRKCFELIARHHGRVLDLASVPAEDPAVYDRIARADTLGVFQIESRAQMSMLPRLKPRCFYDLVIEVAIVRPGPIQGDMVHPYLRRRAGEEQPEYPNEAIRSVLEKTLGVPLFQEQAMRLAVVAAGFSPGEADQLRRAMAAWRKSGLIEKFRDKFLNGMIASGLSRDFAERAFAQIRGFGEYGFPESHAASFAHLVYVSAWLKCHYPAAFACALLNSQPMGFYAPAQIVRDAKEHGVAILPIDVNRSDWDHLLEAPPIDGRMGRPKASGTEQGGPPRGAIAREPPALRLGFRLIRGMPKRDGEAILRAREERPFVSMAEFGRRTGLSERSVARLAKADAFGSLNLDRRRALWESLDGEPAPPLFAEVKDQQEQDVELPTLESFGQVLADYATAGLSLKNHPVAFLRDRLRQLGALAARDLRQTISGRWVQVAGLVLMRQQPSTARGIRFVTLEDETGTINLIVRPNTWERFRRAARSAVALLAHGRLERKHEVTHVLVERLEDLTERLRGLPGRSRDFR